MDEIRIDIEKTLSKSLWKQAQGEGYHFLCPHCKAERKLRNRPTPGGVRHFFQIGVATAFFMLVTWHWFEWKGVVSFFPFWIVFEFFYRTRVRAQLNCPHCGFDPVLYMVDVQKARKQVEDYWRKKFEEKGIPYPKQKGKPESESTAQDAKQAR